MVIVLDKMKDGYVEYDAVFVDPQSLAVLNNDIAMNILKEMTFQPMCAMDLARKLEQHEQKIYYHLNKLQKAGLVKLVGTEKRYGMVAQLYDLVSPVVAAKLNDTGRIVEENGYGKKNYPEILSPFIKDKKFDATIIIGNPLPHGKYSDGSRDGSYIAELAMLFGNHINNIPIPCYKFDTQITEKDLMGNMILIGNPKSNVIVEKIHDRLPLKFEFEGEGSVLFKTTGKQLTDKYVGFIAVFDNPFNPEKKILFLGGKKTRGTRAAVLGFIKFLDKLSKESIDGNVFKIVRGYDKDSDYEIDDVEIIE